MQIPLSVLGTVEGGWRWMETMVTDLTDDPAIGRMVANSRDITEFVQQEQKLMDSVKRYETVSKATSDLITDYDVERDIMVYSDALFEMFGYSEKEVENSGAWWNERVHPEDRELVSTGLMVSTVPDQTRFRSSIAFAVPMAPISTSWTAAIL